MTKKEMFDIIKEGYNLHRYNDAATFFYGYKIKSHDKARFERVYNLFLKDKKRIEKGDFIFAPSFNNTIPNDFYWQLQQLSQYYLQML